MSAPAPAPIPAPIEQAANQLELSAPAFILALLDSASDVEIRAASLVAAAAAFAIDPRTIRVALARLVQKGVLQAVGRGIYRAGTSGGPMQRAVVSWANAEASLKTWDGGWIAVAQSQGNRYNKTAMRANERALRIKGFKTAEPGLAVRPANLRTTLSETRDTLVELGLHPDARLMLVTATAGGSDFANLWSAAQLEAGYRQHLNAMADSTARVPRLNAVDAAKETLLVGRAVTRDIVLDPLLPDALVDAGLRRRMIKAMEKYDRLGKRCWRTFYAVQA